MFGDRITPTASRACQVKNYKKADFTADTFAFDAVIDHSYTALTAIFQFFHKWNLHKITNNESKVIPKCVIPLTYLYKNNWFSPQLRNRLTRNAAWLAWNFRVSFRTVAVTVIKINFLVALRKFAVQEKQEVYRESYRLLRSVFTGCCALCWWFQRPTWLTSEVERHIRCRSDRQRRSLHPLLFRPETVSGAHNFLSKNDIDDNDTGHRWRASIEDCQHSSPHELIQTMLGPCSLLFPPSLWSHEHENHLSATDETRH